MNVMQRLKLTWTKTKNNGWILHTKGEKPCYLSNYGFIDKYIYGYDSVVATSRADTGPAPYIYIHKTLAEAKTSLLRRVARMYPERRK